MAIGSPPPPARAALFRLERTARRNLLPKKSAAASSSSAASCTADAWISPATASSARPRPVSSSAVNSRLTTARSPLAFGRSRSNAPAIAAPLLDPNGDSGAATSSRVTTNVFAVELTHG
jgi:hypothetical protein